MTLAELLKKVLKGEVEVDELDEVTKFELAMEIERDVDELQTLLADL